MSKSMQNSIQTKKHKLSNSMSKPKKDFQNLTLIVMGALFSPIQSKQPLDKYEGAGIQFLPENKSNLNL